MIPQTQSRVGKRGRCFNACIASILEIPEKSVPDFPDDDEDFGPAVHKYLAQHGVSYSQVPIGEVAPIGWHTIEGISPRGGMHAVVGYNGSMVHDPHPQDGTGRGLIRPMFYGLFLNNGQAKDAGADLAALRTLYNKWQEAERLVSKSGWEKPSRGQSQASTLRFRKLRNEALKTMSESEFIGLITKWNMEG